MLHRLLRWIALGTGMGVALLTGTVVLAAPAQAADAGTHYYLALGGSGSVGLQPSAATPRGAPTDDGYADNVVGALRARWEDLQLVHMGCPGETTLTMLAGGDRCHAFASQLGLAVSFLRQHPSTVLVTVDVGFNDLVPCLAHHQVNAACVDLALQRVRTQLPQILAALLAAAGPGVHLVGVGHYDPYLGAYLDGAAGRSFAAQSLAVITQLNAVLRAAYTGAGIPMADVAAAFGMSSITPTAQPGGVVVPLNVARVCALTWECVGPPLGPNPHANADGYRLISEAISDKVSTS